MELERKRVKNLIFFYHKNHDDPFNGTSVYDKALLELLSTEYNIFSVEPTASDLNTDYAKFSNYHYFVNLVKRVYVRQFQWLFDIIKGNHLTSPEDTILLVEDIYSSIIPLFVSKIKGYRTIFRAADFGKQYSKSLFRSHPVYRFIYSAFRRIIEHFMVYNSSIIICPSENVKRSLLQRFPLASYSTIVFPYIRVKEGNSNVKKQINEDLSSKTGKVNLLFLGDFRYPPNYDAGCFLLNDMIPALDRIEEIRDLFVVKIAGIKSDVFLRSDSESTQILGAVENLDNLFSDIDIGLAPMKTPGGLSMKVVDYLTHGLRVVATPEAAYGVTSNEQMMLADLQDFANTVKELILKVKSNGVDFHTVSQEVQNEYMSDHWRKELLEYVENIGPSTRKQSKKHRYT